MRLHDFKSSSLKTGSIAMFLTCHHCQRPGRGRDPPKSWPALRGNLQAARKRSKPKQDPEQETGNWKGWRQTGKADVGRFGGESPEQQRDWWRLHIRMSCFSVTCAVVSTATQQGEGSGIHSPWGHSMFNSHVLSTSMFCLPKVQRHAQGQLPEL